MDCGDKMLNKIYLFNCFKGILCDGETVFSTVRDVCYRYKCVNKCPYKAFSRVLTILHLERVVRSGDILIVCVPLFPVQKQDFYLQDPFHSPLTLDVKGQVFLWAIRGSISFQEIWFGLGYVSFVFYRWVISAACCPQPFLVYF